MTIDIKKVKRKSKENEKKRKDGLEEEPWARAFEVRETCRSPDMKMDRIKFYLFEKEEVREVGRKDQMHVRNLWCVLKIFDFCGSGTRPDLHEDRGRSSRKGLKNRYDTARSGRKEGR